MRYPFFLALLALVLVPVAHAATPILFVTPPGWTRSDPPEEVRSEGIARTLIHETGPAMIGLGIFPADISPAQRADKIAEKLRKHFGVVVTGRSSDAGGAIYDWRGPDGSDIIGRTVIRLVGGKTKRHILIAGFWPKNNPDLSEDFERIAASARTK